MPQSRRELLTTLLTGGAAASFGALQSHAAAAADWPNWRGPRFDGGSSETGLKLPWPAEGARVLWKTDLPGGYSSMVAAKGRLYTQVRDGGEEAILCHGALTGELIWRHAYPVNYDGHPTLDARFKSGPRSTPTVSGNRVVALGTFGDLTCLDAASGKVHWKSNLLELTGRTCPEFGYCGSPVIEKGRIHLHPGGGVGKSVSAYKLSDGKQLWSVLDDKIGYSTPFLAKNGKRDEMVHFTAQGYVALEPATGRELWRYDWKTNFDLNCATPLQFDDYLFVSSNYGRGCALIRMKPDGAPEEIYRSQEMHNHFSTSVYHDNHLYGFSADRLKCLEARTGTVKWEQRGLGRGSIVLADGHLLILGERGDLVAATATPTAYQEKCRWKALTGACWSVPILSNKVLYLRHEKQMLAVDLR